MKKILYLIILLIPFIVSAEDVTYEVCKSGCAYDSVDATYQAITTLDTSKQYNITINIKDGETYNIQDSTLDRNFYNGSDLIKDSSLIIKGTGSTRPTITTDSTTKKLNVIYFKSVTIENVNFESSVGIRLGATGNSRGVLNVKNSNLKSDIVGIYGDDSILDNVNVLANEFHFQPESGNVNSVIKNSKINTLNSNNNKVTIRFFATIENTEITAPTVQNYGIVMKGSTINGNVVAEEKQVYKNSKINGHVSINLNQIEFDNVEITDGLNLHRTYCEMDYNPANDYESYIKNSKIYGEVPLTIRSRDRYNLLIENTDLDDTTKDNSCSITVNSPQVQTCPKSNTPSKKLMPSYLKNEDTFKNISINVKNSKVNCAKTYSEDVNNAALDLFFDYQTKWSKPIVRSNDLESTANVVERNNGNIYIEAGAEDTLKLNVDLEKNISEYFKDIIPNGSVLGDWFIEDESILKVENGKIIPLKAGTTAIYSVIDNNVYSVYITVTDDMVNPGTGGSIHNVILLIVVLSLIALILHLKRPIKI